MNFYALDGDRTTLERPGRNGWISAIAAGITALAEAAVAAAPAIGVGAAIGSGIGAAAYTTNRAIHGQMPWEEPLEGFKGALKASAIGAGTGAITGGLGSMLGGAGGAGAGAGQGLGQGVEGAVQAGEIAPAAGSLAEAGGDIVSSSGETIGSAAVQESTAAAVPFATPAIEAPASTSATIGQTLRDVGTNAFKGAAQQTLGEALQGRAPDPRSLAIGAAGSFAGGLVDAGVGAATPQGVSDFANGGPAPMSGVQAGGSTSAGMGGPGELFPASPEMNPIAMQQRDIIGSTKDQLMRAFSPRGAAERFVGGALKLPGQGAQMGARNLVSEALAPPMPGMPQPNTLGIYAKNRPQGMTGAMGTLGGLGGGIGRGLV